MLRREWDKKNKKKDSYRCVEENKRKKRYLKMRWKELDEKKRRRRKIATVKMRWKELDEKKRRTRKIAKDALRRIR